MTQSQERMTPKRIQRKRTKGWRKPEGAVYVGRGSRWGNPYKVGVNGTAEECVEKYRDYVVLMFLEPLRGKDLMCWCRIECNGSYVTCHADILLSLANDIPLDEVMRENIRAATRETMR